MRPGSVGDGAAGPGVRDAMRPRAILLVLSLLTLLSSSIGGYLYYSALKHSALQAIGRQTAAQAEALQGHFNSFIAEQLRTVRVLAGMAEVRAALGRPGAESLGEANRLLDLFRDALEVDVCYLMDASGDTLASSNRDDPDSFVGRNFGFRPYFRRALQGESSTYLALGATSNVRGLYYSHPVHAPGGGPPVGVAVIKAALDAVEQELAPVQDEIVLLTDPHGIIFLSSRPEWRFQSIWELSPAEIDEIAASFQFGSGPWEWSGLTFLDGDLAADRSGDRYLAHQIPIRGFPGWSILYLRNYRSVMARILAPLTYTHGALILGLCLLVAASVLVLYRTGTRDLIERRRAEAALREGEERYRTLYHHTPAILHSIDPEGRLLSVSDYWSEALGHPREEVVGRKVTDFMTPESRQYAEREVIPAFLAGGVCRDVPYRFVRKDGSVIDVLLSAIAERDAGGRVVRSLAVLLDVTQLKRAQEELSRAKEALSRYSRELEAQVRERTQEISSILRHTPAVVYIKDREGRYTLVNERFEAIFGVSAAAVRGKTDFDLFPEAAARQFRANDAKVLAGNESFQAEEHVPQADGDHTYLSVKFPLLDEGGRAHGVCGISTDITPLTRAQDQLRRLSGSILAGQEQERAALARELHDQLGQVLTALRLDAVWLLRRLERLDDAEALRRGLDMCDLIDETIDEIRGMALRLRPGVLDDLGLVDALEWCVADFEKRTGIPCTFRHAGVPEIRDRVATAAYRIAQEALTNVARHAGAGHVAVTLEADGEALTLTVADDGRGFPPRELERSRGLGVAGMRERANLLGGALEIASRPGAGTTVACRLPMPARQEVAG